MTTMEQSIENPANIRGVCFCCLADGSFKNMYQSFKWIDHSEVYADMMLNCYNISIGDVARDTKPLICEVCIVRLRDSLAFRKQVENSCEVMKNATSLPETNVFELPIQKWEGDEEEDSFNWDDTEAREDTTERESDSYYLVVKDEDVVGSKKKSPRSQRKLQVKSHAQLKRKSRSGLYNKKVQVDLEVCGLKRNTRTSLKKNEANVVKKKSKTADEAVAGKETSCDMKISRTEIRLGQVLDYTLLLPIKWCHNHFICVVCNKKLPELHLLGVHLKEHENMHVKESVKKLLLSGKIVFMNALNLSCTQCEFATEEVESFKKHIVENHEADMSKEFWGTILPLEVYDSGYGCHVCKEKIKHFATLNKHMNQHYANFVCNECGKTFVLQRRLKEHLRRFHAIGDFTCRECKVSFTHMHKLDNHNANFHRAPNKQRLLKYDAESASNFSEELTEKAMESKRGMKPRKYVLKQTVKGGHRKVILKKEYGLLIENAKLSPFKWYEGKFTCAACEERYRSLVEFHVHANSHEHEDIEAKVTSSHITDQVIYMDVTTLTCIKCGDVFKTSQDFKDHIINKHKVDPNRDFWGIITPMKFNNTTYDCTSCEQSCNHFLTLMKHLNSHAGIVCPSCGKSFVNKSRLSRHVMRLHTKGEYPCKFCDVIFPSLAKLEYHVSSMHRRPAGARCPHCPVVLPTFDAKVRHLLIVHKEEPNWNKCDLCPKRYITASLLTRHKINAHVKERNHICEVCGSGFYLAHTLKEHSRIHTGERPFTCNVCFKSFPRAYSFREHMKIHNNVRRFSCSICGRTFIQKCSLKSHMKTHEKRGEV